MAMETGELGRDLIFCTCMARFRTRTINNIGILLHKHRDFPTVW